MKTFFTSDTHFGHANIIRYSARPWCKPTDFTGDGNDGYWASQAIARQRAREMDDALIKNWNEVVTDEDDVYHLGDFCFGSGKDALEILNRLNFNRFYFVWGNHDKGMQDVFRLQKSASPEKEYADLLSRIYFIGNMKEIVINGQGIVLNHYAMRVWNKSHRENWHLYGHSHGSLPDDPHSRSFDVGVDCTGYKPLTFEEVAKIMATKLWKPIDHHGERQEGGGIGLDKEAYAKLDRQRLYQQLKREFES
jgi:calcineurin-like phosphoesterase family protein